MSPGSAVSSSFRSQFRFADAVSAVGVDWFSSLHSPPVSFPSRSCRKGRWAGFTAIQIEVCTAKRRAVNRFCRSNKSDGPTRETSSENRRSRTVIITEILLFSPILRTHP